MAQNVIPLSSPIRLRGSKRILAESDEEEVDIQDTRRKLRRLHVEPEDVEDEAEGTDETMEK